MTHTVYAREYPPPKFSLAGVVVYIFNSITQRQRQTLLVLKATPVYRESWARQDYIMRSCLKNKTTVRKCPLTPIPTVICSPTFLLGRLREGKHLQLHSCSRLPCASSVGSPVHLPFSPPPRPELDSRLTFLFSPQHQMKEHPMV